MSYPLHTQGVIRAMAKPTWVHIRNWFRDPPYRALHRFSSSVRGRRFAEPIEVRYSGRRIRLVDGPSFLSAWDEIFVNRIYDIGDCRHVPRLVDAGANIGLAALYWKLRYGEIRYVGFEPDRINAGICRENLEAWGCDGELHECAVTAGGNNATFLPDGADAGKVVVDSTEGECIRVRSVRLSSYLGESTDLLKLDIEGSEVEVLEEIVGQLGQVRNIFVEAHSVPDRPQPFARVFRILQDSGFRCFIQSGFGPVRPFSVHGETQGDYELLANVFGVREAVGLPAITEET